VWVLDDYGHHPAEIEASLEACAQFKRRILLVYQPHRFSRTHHLMDELALSFGKADQLYLLDIYAAGEEPIEGITSERLAKLISEHRQVKYVPSSEEMLQVLVDETLPGDLVVTMGAGDVWKIGEAFLEKKESN
jgi:UDP-N-acetylmuramate--alanine ligase